MRNKIPNIRHAALYARTENKKLVCEILKIEGIRSLSMVDGGY